jgi:hypothetical protein
MAAAVAAAFHPGGLPAAVAAAMTAAALDLRGLAAASAMATALAAFFGRDGHGDGERGGAGEQDEVTHDETPVGSGKERPGSVRRSVCESTLRPAPRSDRPTKLNLAFQRLNGG